ncbi:MAG: SpoIID/LytB domain-containing protein [Clostridia bacterium]|nr:SpoIID/LytB domain-containing protein [Clostridia bacterium]
MILRRAVILALTIVFISFATPAAAFWFFESNDDPTPAPEVYETPSPTASEQPSSDENTTLNSTNIELSPTVEPSPTPMPPIEDIQTDESSTLRVWLSSLGNLNSIGLTLMGSYALENDAGFRFADEVELEIIADDEYLYINSAGMIVNLGSTFTLTRHTEESGIVIHETNRANLYNGNLRLVNDAGSIRAILYIDIEEYLYGVVPYEMSDSFPIEALKAQAVAARTYAASRKNANRDYDVVDTTNDQVYRGFNGDTINTIAAVDETRGIVGLYNGKYATCYFTASNGGQTAMPDQIWGNAGDYGWLDVRDDPYDVENPSSPVKTLDISVVPLDNEDRLLNEIMSLLTEQMASLGYSDEAEDITILSINSATPVEPLFSGENRMYSKLRLGLTVQGKVLYEAFPTPNAQTTPLYMDEVVDHELYVDLDFYTLLKDEFGLKISSIDCELLTVVEITNDEGVLTGFRLESRRFGHGVGMSQRGAQQMAREYDMTYREILAFYYPGMTLVRMDYARDEILPLSDLPNGIGGSRPRPTPRPTPAPLPALGDGERYATAKLDSNASTLNVRDIPSTSGVILGTLTNGQRLIVMEVYSEQGWAKIKTAELEGYASMDYLSIQ